MQPKCGCGPPAPVTVPVPVSMTRSHETLAPGLWRLSLQAVAQSAECHCQAPAQAPSCEPLRHTDDTLAVLSLPSRLTRSLSVRLWTVTNSEPLVAPQQSVMTLYPSFCGRRQPGGPAVRIVFLFPGSWIQFDLHFWFNKDTEISLKSVQAANLFSGYGS